MKQDSAAASGSLASGGGIRRRVATAALIIMLGNVASRVLGLVREQVIAGLFGTSGSVDAFTAASAVPSAVYDLLIGGALSAALIPVFSEIAEKEGDAALSRLSSTILTLAAAVLIPAILLLVMVAPLLVTLVAAGLSPEDQAATELFLRLLLPSLLFLGMSGVVTALLYARHVVTYPAFTVAIYNASIIVAALTLAAVFGPLALVLGVLVGTLGQLALQLPGLRGIRLRPSLDLSHPALRRIILLYAPVAAGIVISNIGIIIDRNLASRVGEGTLAVMRYATTLVQLPLGLVGTAASFAVLPTLSRFTISATSPPDELRSYKATLAFGLKLVLLAILPMTVGLMVLREPIIRLLLERGVFSARDTEITALAFLCYSPSIPFAAIDQVLIVAYYARKNTLTPMLVGVAGTAVYLIVAFVLIGQLGMPGLVLANSAQWIAHAVILFVLLWRSTGGLGSLGLGSTLIKVGCATLLLGAVSWASANILATILPGNGLVSQLAGTLLPVVLGGVSYVGALWLLRVEEMYQLAELVARRMGRGTPTR